MQHIETIIVQLREIGVVLQQCMDGINIALEGSVVESSPSLPVCFGIDPVHEAFLIDALILLDEVNKQLCFALDSFQYGVMQK